MLLAGLYDVVTLEGLSHPSSACCCCSSAARHDVASKGQTTPLYTFTIVTTDANKDFDWLHDRQPVILSTTEALRQWLDTSSQQWTPELSKLLRPYSDTESKLTWYVFLALYHGSIKV